MSKQLYSKPPLENTLIHLLQHRAHKEPEKVIYTWLQDGEHANRSLTYAELNSRALAIAGHLKAAGLERNRALLLFPPGLEFIEAFFGCLYAGMIAVPAYVPGTSRDHPRIEGILRDAECGIALTTEASLPSVSRLIAEFDSSIACAATDGMPDTDSFRKEGTRIEAEQIAYLQYTSGSTSAPKGVMVTHANVLANLGYIAARGGFTQSTVSVSWLPHFHDMGLIYGILQPLFSGFPLFLLSPAAFIHRPLRWLKAISHYRGTHCGGPNFAYQLCVDRIGAEEKALLDLSSWKVAFNGAEPVRYETLERFALHFAECGFSRNSFYPVYGLAEASLKVTSGQPGSGARICNIDASAIQVNRVELVAAEDENACQAVSCGSASGGHEVVVVDPNSGKPCEEDRVGEIWFSGPSVAIGYWRNADETQKTFGAILENGQGPYLRTGDLGFLHGGELFITGRLKDCIIIRGRNHYPQDFENTVGKCHPALRHNGSAAFSVQFHGQESLVIVSEVNRKYQGDTDEIIHSIRQAIAEEHEIQAFGVVLIRSGSLPRTSSGKVQRRQCKDNFTDGALLTVAQSILNEEPALDMSSIPFGGRETLLALDPAERHSVLRNYLQGLVAHALRQSQDSVRPADSLAGLGIDSLTAFALKHRVESDLDLAIPLSELLGGNIDQIAGWIAANIQAKSEEVFPQTQSPTFTRPAMARLSHAQEQVWFMQQLSPESCAYNEPLVMRFTGQLAVSVLSQAIHDLIRRHEILRTSFVEHEGTPYQIVRDFEPRPVPLARTVTVDIEQELQTLVQTETRRPFRLDQESPVRFLVIQAGEDRHFLLFVAHHIICDGTSLPVLVRDVRALYEAHSLQQTPELPPLKMQYADYSSWQRERNDSGMEVHMDYWRRQLDGVSVLELPADYPRPTVMSDEGACVSFGISKESTGRLKDFSRREGVTLFMHLLAALQIVLSKYSGQQDIAVGTAIASRNLPGSEDLIGLFVNTLVLRTELRNAISIRDLLTAIKSTTLAAFEHQEVPFTRLVRELQPDRDLSRTPLFQVMLVFEPSTPNEVAFGDIQVDFPEFQPGIAKFDLLLRVAESKSGLRIAIEYSKSLFAVSTIERLAEHFSAMLEKIVAEPDARLGDISLLTAAERQRMLETWNRTEAHYRTVLLHELFEEQAKADPAKVALTCDGRQVTYLEIHRQANQLARYLRKSGVGREARVGVCMNRTPEMVMVLLAILKAGGTYVPLDPAYPRDRLLYMLQDAMAEVLVIHSQFKTQFDEDRIKTIVIDEEWEQATRESCEDIQSGVDPQNLAYLIYTSGSTGKPKGVAITHNSAGVFLHWAREVFTDEELSGVLISTSICFDLSVFEIFVPLSWGGKGILVTNVLDLPGYMDSGEVRLVNTVPSAIRELLQMKGVPPSVITVNLAGEALKRSLVTVIYGQGHIQKVFNLYGPSEDTTYSTFVLVNREKEGAVAIGKPIANTRVYVVDREMVAVPVGVAGELYIGGEGLARGYLNRPDLTGERFVPDPFSSAGGERLYRTGDQVRWRGDGNLEFLGRLDQQVKVRGYRIELGEIETALLGHEAVEQAVVTVRGEHDKYVAAYVVGSRRGEEVSAAELRGYVKGILPEYMVPAAFVFLEELPLTPNGKVDRKGLPEPERRAGGEYVGPGNETEELLCRMWEEVLGLEKVGVEDNFFELGGHSLLATQLISRVRTTLGLEIPLRSLFKAPTVRRFAAELESARAVKYATNSPLLVAHNDDRREFPLSFAQQRMWMLNQLDQSNAAYNMSAAFQLTGKLEVEGVRQALNGIVRRHAVLRTIFLQQEEELVQRILPEIDTGIEITDLCDIPDAERLVKARQLVRDEAETPFNLAAGPLLRMRLLRMEEQRHILIVTMHHIVSDGWSVGIMANEFSRLYEAHVTGEQLFLPELEIQYVDYALWQREMLQNEVLQEQLSYWKRQLSALPPLELPRQQASSSSNSGRAEDISFFLPAEFTARLKQLSRDQGATLFMSILAAFNLLLSKYSGQQDIATGTVVANRNRLETEKVIGFFVNTLILRVDLTGNPTFFELLCRTRQAALDAYRYQDVPFEKLVEELQPDRVSGQTPFTPVMIALQNTAHAPLQLPSVEVSEFPLGSKIAKFDLELVLREQDDGIAGELSYACGLFEKSIVERMAAHFRLLLELVAANPDARTGEISLLSGDERQKVLADWNQTGSEYRRQCAHELFSLQAERTPNAIAVAYGSRQMTYEELDRQSTQLARYLRERGVRPEARAGICMDRTPQMIVAMLGILKAGGAYVPLDKSYPAERLEFMVKDAGLKVLLTHQDLVARLPESGVPVLCVDQVWPEIAKAGSEQFASEAIPENLAYMIYTSGSTGTPKAVTVTHKSLANLIQWHLHTYHVTPADRATQVAIQAFDASVWEMWPYLVCGSCIDLPDQETSASPAHLFQWFAERQITITFLPTPLAEIFVNGSMPEGLKLKYLLTGGDRLRPGNWTHLPFSLVNHYGPTESTVVTTSAVVAPGAIPPIGKPIANTRVYVVDREMVAVPVGVAGELYIGGEGLARGYLNRPDLTGERFVPDPFSSAGGERLYRTGDQVRWRGDGNLEFLGRLDQQVKVRGYRIELGEIETALLGHEAVEQAVVTVRGEHDKYVAAYVVGCRRGEEVSAAELRSYVKGILPEYMVPAAFVFLEELPLTPNGKVDRKGLPEPERRAGGEYVGPGNETEELLCRMWEEVLGLEKVGVEDNFFELGGHSLLATQLISRVRSTFEVDFPLQMLFERPTIAALAEIIDECRIEMLADESLSDPFMAESNLEYVEENEK